MINLLKDILSIAVPVITLVLAFLGLSTWRKKLWGENKFTLSTSTINELYLLKEEIKNYRMPFYSAGEIYQSYNDYVKRHPEESIDKSKSSDVAEIVRWEKVGQIYNSYYSFLVKLKVLLDNYEIDKIKSKTIESYLRDINVKRAVKQLQDRQKEYIPHMSEEQMKDFSKQQEELTRVLNRFSDDDPIEKEIEAYFNEFKKRVRKYLK